MLKSLPIKKQTTVTFSLKSFSVNVVPKTTNVTTDHCKMTYIMNDEYHVNIKI
jgi:hypothetical protein